MSRPSVTLPLAARVPSPPASTRRMALALPLMAVVYSALSISDVAVMLPAGMRAKEIVELASSLLFAAASPPPMIGASASPAAKVTRETATLGETLIGHSSFAEAELWRSFGINRDPRKAPRTRDAAFWLSGAARPAPWKMSLPLRGD